MESMQSWDWTKTPVKVLVGKNRTVYHIHRDALIQNSPVWKARLEGSWMNDDRELDWTNFENGTVDCVLEFLYTGNYSMKRFQVPENSCVHKNESEPTKDLNYEGHSDTTQLDGELLCSECTFEKQLIGVSRVYAFANQVSHSKLESFSLDKLRCTMDSFNSRLPNFLHNVIDVAQYIYENTIEKCTETESARVLLMESLVDHLNNPDDFDSILDFKSDFIKDLFKKLVMRAIESETNAESLTIKYTARIRELERTLRQYGERY